MLTSIEPRQKIDYPDSKTRINEGDKFLVVADADELAKVDNLSKGKILLLKVPEKSLS